VSFQRWTNIDLSNASKRRCELRSIPIIAYVRLAHHWSSSSELCPSPHCISDHSFHYLHQGLLYVGDGLNDLLAMLEVYFLAGVFLVNPREK